MSFFGKNIKKIRTVKSLSQQAFAEMFDLKRGTLGAYEEGRSEPKIDTVIKIAKHFSISIDELLTKELTVNRLLRFKGDFAENQDELLKEQFASVPCIVPTNRNSYLSEYGNQEFISRLPCLRLPISRDLSFRGFVVDSLEMSSHEKGLFPKDVVVGQFVPKKEYKNLDNGKLLLVITEDQLVLRRGYILKSSLVLRADHKLIEDITLGLDEVKELWNICYVFYHRVPETGNGLEEKLMFLEQEFAKIKSQI